jgi:hypothetical protein
MPIRPHRIKFLSLLLGLAALSACAPQPPATPAPSPPAARIASITRANTPHPGAYGYDLVARFPHGTHDPALGQLLLGTSDTKI